MSAAVLSVSRATSALLHHRRLQGRRRAVTYIAVGLANTAGYFVAYNSLRLTLDAFQANSISVALSISFSFWANRRYTFGRRGRQSLGRQFGAFSTMFLVTLVLSNVALLLLFRLRAEPAVWLENVALIGSSSALLVVRYVLMRAIFLGRTPTEPFVADGAEAPVAAEVTAA